MYPMAEAEAEAEAAADLARKKSAQMRAVMRGK
jgi:hypothetical protein